MIDFLRKMQMRSADADLQMGCKVDRKQWLHVSDFVFVFREVKFNHF